MPDQSFPRRAAALVAAAVLGGLVVAAPAAAVEDVAQDRIGGNDRYETAALIAEEAYPTGAGTVLIANGVRAADALAGAALAGDLGAPLLLTFADSLPPATVEAIDDLGATRAIILGGTAVVTDAVEDELDKTLTVERIGGVDRYETAADVARRLGTLKIGTVGGRKTAIVATGIEFADALSGSPLAAAGQNGELPVLLVNSTVPAHTEDAIDDLGIDQVIILGGTGPVSSSVEEELEELTGNAAIRYGGTNRFDTAAILADALVTTYGFDGTDVFLANGFSFADALTGGPLAARREAPLLLTVAAQLSPEAKSWLERRSATVERVTALGGTAVITAATLNAAEQAAEADPPPGDNETITVTPRSAVRQANGSSREYTATGLAGPVDIVVVPCANVKTIGGDTVFTNTNRNGIADGTAEGGSAPDVADVPDVRISSVNGTPRGQEPAITNDDYVNNAAPASGTVTFTVLSTTDSGDAEVCVRPVVFTDADLGNSLTVNTSNPATPIEAFGTGGDVTFAPAAATSGTLAAHNVTSVDKPNDSFTACQIASTVPTEVPNTEECRTFRYDSNDVFQIGNDPSTMAAFEAAMSAGDDVQGSYADTAPGKSTFRLTDENPTAPEISEAEAQPDGTVKVSFGDISGADSYTLYRALQTGTPAACPAFTEGQRGSHTNWTEVTSTPDTGDNAVSPANYTITDTGAPANTTVCYVVVAVNDGDEGPGSEPATATTLAGAPTITSATGTDAAPSGVGPGDVHELAFSEQVRVAPNASYRVQETSPVAPFVGDITCGANAICTPTGVATRTLRVTLTGPPTSVSGLPDPTYPVTITDTTGIAAVDNGEEPSLTTGDTTIEGNSRTGDTTGPMITAARMSNDVGSLGFGSVGDAITLTFDDVVDSTESDGRLSEAQLESVLGTAVAYAADTVVTISDPATPSNQLVITITAVGLNEGIGIGEDVPGDANTIILDDSGNAQQANPAPAKLASSTPTT